MVNQQLKILQDKAKELEDAQSELLYAMSIFKGSNDITNIIHAKQAKVDSIKESFSRMLNEYLKTSDHDIEISSSIDENSGKTAYTVSNDDGNDYQFIVDIVNYYLADSVVMAIDANSKLLKVIF